MAAPLFELKDYQRTTLERLRVFLEKAVELGSADGAFYEVTKRPFTHLPTLPELPYVCLRVPTGGGKTILAAYTVAVAADTYLRTDTPAVLWLVPSQTIRDQTIASLQDRVHPNRRALADRFGENIRVMDVPEALYAKRADYDGGAVVIVSTLQAFRVEETEGRKVYEANGELMDHFTGLTAELCRDLDAGPSGTPLPSLANVLRLRRPMVVVDEAHNARTDLSFDTLARLAPSLIVEFTATPILPNDGDATKGRYASNVLHHVSASALKAEEMIKLPVILRGRSDPKETIADAIGCLDELAKVSRAEEQETGEFVRPVMLVQAEANLKKRETLHAEAVKALLMEDFLIPETEIAIATGGSREIDDVDLFDRDCPIRFIITQQALREGWDCSFAYVLCSVAEQKSARAVEQLLGRVLRLPHARRKRREELNRAYAFATTTSFQHAAQTLRDGLVSNGFEKIEAKTLIQVHDDAITGLELGGHAIIAEEPIPAGIDVERFKQQLEGSMKGRVEFDIEANVFRARGTLTDYDKRLLELTMPAEAQGAINALVHKSRGARLKAPRFEKDPIHFAVPRLTVRKFDSLELFDRTHFLDIPWKLEQGDPKVALNFFQPPQAKTDGAILDVSQQGKAVVQFVDQLHQQLALALEERRWTRPALINWLDRRLPNNSRRDITRVSSTLFIDKALSTVEQEHDLDLERLARGKFRLVDALIKTIAKLREERQATAFEQALFPQSGLDFVTSADHATVFNESTYAYYKPYEGNTAFEKHFCRVIGDLEPKGEEFDCAVHLERHPAIKSWVRNTAKQPHSFWLQTSTDKFYPDFVALLEDGRVLVVEYKGKPYATNDDSKEKILVGNLWADRSEGHCIFLMVQAKEFGQIDQAIAAANHQTAAA